MATPEIASSATATACLWQPALFAMMGTIIGGLIVGTFPLIATGKQLRAQTGREFMLIRQRWIENLRERIPEIIKTAGWFCVSKMKDHSLGGNEEWSPEHTSQTLKVVQLTTEVTLMLDLTDKDHISLREAMDRMDRVRDCAFATGTKLVGFDDATKILTSRCATAQWCWRRKQSAQSAKIEAAAFHNSTLMTFFFALDP